MVHRRNARIHGPGDLRRVPGLAVPVREHPPEAAVGLRGDLRAESGNVPLQEGARERLHPPRPGRRGRREPGARETAAHPEPVQRGGADLGEGEPGRIHEQDPPGQGLGDPPDEIPEALPSSRKTAFRCVIVAEGTQRLEEPRRPLHLVEDDQTLAHPQHPLGGGGKRLPDAGAFEIEEDRRTRPAVRDLPARVRLADLPGAEERGRRGLGERLRDRRPQVRTGGYVVVYPLSDTGYATITAPATSRASLSAVPRRGVASPIAGRRVFRMRATTQRAGDLVEGHQQRVELHAPVAVEAAHLRVGFLDQQQGLGEGPRPVRARRSSAGASPRRGRAAPPRSGAPPARGAWRGAAPAAFSSSSGRPAVRRVRGAAFPSRSARAARARGGMPRPTTAAIRSASSASGRSRSRGRASARPRSPRAAAAATAASSAG